MRTENPMTKADSVLSTPRAGSPDELHLADDNVAFDAQNTTDGMHRVANEIWERAMQLRQALDDDQPIAKGGD
jgi:hypothetical protein